MFQKQTRLPRSLCHLGLDACNDQHAFIVAPENAKPHYLVHTCLQNKEPSQFNLRHAASVVNQINFYKMEIKAFDEIVIVQHIFHFRVFFYLEKKGRDLLQGEREKKSVY
mgnify:CR=1 FL=1